MDVQLMVSLYHIMLKVLTVVMLVGLNILTLIVLKNTLESINLKPWLKD